MSLLCELRYRLRPSLQPAQKDELTGQTIVFLGETGRICFPCSWTVNAGPIKKKCHNPGQLENWKQPVIDKRLSLVL